MARVKMFGSKEAKRPYKKKKVAKPQVRLCEFRKLTRNELDGYLGLSSPKEARICSGRIPGKGAIEIVVEPEAVNVFFWDTEDEAYASNARVKDTFKQAEKLRTALLAGKAPTKTFFRQHGFKNDSL